MGRSNTIWTSNEIARVLNGTCDGQWEALRVSIDSRDICEGDVFIALVGDQNDGHDYVAQALESGAVGAIVERDIEGVSSERLIVVADTFKALEDLGRAARARSSAKIIGITGSVGKTGTKELLAAAFQDQGQVHASVKSYNNKWGVPLSLSNMHGGTDFGVFEMGMNHAHEITPLSQQVRPHIAIITTIASAHIENFENGLEGIADAKAEIFDGLEPGGVAILNKDNDWFDHLADKARAKNIEIYSFGEATDSDARLISCLEAANGTRTKAVILNEEVEFSLQIAGKHIAQNALAVLLSVKLSGGDIQKAIRSISQQTAVVGRGARESLNYGDPENPVTLIDESYNASPDAMRAAFKVLALIDPGRGGRRIAVLGDMLELGKHSAKSHADLALPLKTSNVDLVYTCGAMMKNLHDALSNDQRAEHKPTSKELAKIVPDVLVPGDVVMVKGSLGSKMGTVVEALRAFPSTLQSSREKG